MGYRTFSEKTTHDDASDSIVFTEAALLAHPEADVAALAAPLTTMVLKGDGLALARTHARRAMVRANALVRSVDAQADDAVRDFAKDVLGEVRQDRGHPLYLALFGKRSPAEVANLALAPEVEEIENFLQVLDGKLASDALKKQWSKKWKLIHNKANDALGQRKEATAKLAEAQSEVTRWVERGDRARRSIDGALTQFAADNELASDFNDRFFPLVAKARKTPVATAPVSTPTPPAPAPKP